MNAVVDALAPLGVTTSRCPPRPSGSGARSRRWRSDPGQVRLRGGRVGRATRSSCSARARGREAPRGRPLAAPADEAPLRAAVAARRHRAALAISRYVRDDGDAIAIGALTRHRDVQHRRPARAKDCPMSRTRRGWSATRRCATAARSAARVAHGDPASDLPTVLLALDAELVVAGPSGERTIPAAEFFRGFLETALGAAGAADRDPRPEARRRLVVREVQPPRPGLGDRRRGGRAHERRAEGRADEHGPDAAAGDRGRGRARRRRRLDEAAAAAAEGTSPPSDTNGSADFRHHLATVLTRRALEKALAA